MARSSRRKSVSLHPSNETRAAEFLTVGWMVSMVTTLACLVVFGLLRGFLAFQPEVEALEGLSALVLFAAVVTGITTLVLLPLVFRVRRDKPPPGITWFALAVGAAPLVIILVRAAIER